MESSDDDGVRSTSTATSGALKLHNYHSNPLL